MIGVERVTGVAFSHVELSSLGQSATIDEMDATLLWSQGGGEPYATPRIAFDGIVARHCTLGGAIGYATEIGIDGPEWNDDGSPDRLHLRRRATHRRALSRFGGRLHHA